MKCVKEAIKCHGIDIAKYFQENYVENTDENQIEFIIQFIKCFNFSSMKKEFINQTYFYYFCRYEYYFLAEVLLENGIDNINQMQIKNGHERTALYAAVKKENIDIIKLLLTNDNIDVNILNKHCLYSYREEKTALHAAVEKENIDIIKLLLANDKIDVNIYTIFEEQERDNSHYLYDGEYIKEHTRYEYIEYTALYAAVTIENIDIIKLLLTNGNIDVNIINKGIRDHEERWEKTALYTAVEKENIGIIKALLTNDNIDVNILNKDYIERYERTALYAAVEKENIDVIKVLLTYDKIDVNILNKYQLKYQDMFIRIENEERWEKTALYAAVEKENIDIIKLLLANDNIDVNILYKYEKQERRGKIGTGFLGIYNDLLDIINNQYTFDGECKEERYEKTALYAAVEKENIDIINALLANDKIDVNILDKHDKEESAVLHESVKRGNIEIIKLLLKQPNIQVDILDEKGRKPIDLANDPQIIQLFPRENLTIPLI